MRTAYLATVIVLGSLALWIGVPVGGLWLAGHVTSDALTAVLFALIAIPLGMAMVGWGLYRANASYEALHGGPARHRSPPAWRTSLGEERASTRRRADGRSLIDVAMTVSAALALVVMTVWFFFYAELQLTPFP